MNFDINKVREEGKKAKKHIKANGINGFKALEGIRFVEHGTFASVYAWNDLAMKVQSLDFGTKKHGYTGTPEGLDEYVKKSDICFKLGLCVAPIFDWVYDKDHNTTVAFMPFIGGDTIKSAEGLGKLANLGADGLRTFITNDYPAVHELGFQTDNKMAADNYIVSDTNINMIDLALHNEPHVDYSEDDIMYLNKEACGVVLDYWYKQTHYMKRNVDKGEKELQGEFADMKKKFRALAGNVEGVVSRIPNASELQASVNAIRKSDFKDLIYV